MEEVHETLMGLDIEELGDELGDAVTAEASRRATECEWYDGLRKLRRACTLPLLQGLSAEADADADADSRSVSTPVAANAPQPPGPQEAVEKMSARTSQGRLVMPELKSTCVLSRAIMVVELLMQWNYRVPEDACCNFHAGVRAVQAICLRLWADPCKDMPVLMETQCPKCGLLIDECCPICSKSSMLHGDSDSGSQVPPVTQPGRECPVQL